MSMEELEKFNSKVRARQEAEIESIQWWSNWRLAKEKDAVRFGQTNDSDRHDHFMELVVKH